MSPKKTLADLKKKMADYIRTDPEVDDLVRILNESTLVDGAGDYDLDEPTPVLVGVVRDPSTGERAKGAIAIVQDVRATKNSVVQFADSLLREWYLEHNQETIQSCLEEDREYDSEWEAMVWDLSAPALDEVLAHVDGSVLSNLSIERDFS